MYLPLVTGVYGLQSSALALGIVTYIKESKTKLVENSENDRGSVCDCDNEVSIEDCLLSRMLDCLLPLPVLSLYSVFCQQNGNGDPVFRKERTFCLSLSYFQPIVVLWSNPNPVVLSRERECLNASNNF